MMNIIKEITIAQELQDGNDCGTCNPLKLLALCKPQKSSLAAAAAGLPGLWAKIRPPPTDGRVVIVRFAVKVVAGLLVNVNKSQNGARARRE